MYSSTWLYFYLYMKIWSGWIPFSLFFFSLYLNRKLVNINMGPNVSKIKVCEKDWEKSQKKSILYSFLILEPIATRKAFLSPFVAREVTGHLSLSKHHSILVNSVQGKGRSEVIGINKPWNPCSKQRGGYFFSTDSHESTIQYFAPAPSKWNLKK